MRRVASARWPAPRQHRRRGRGARRWRSSGQALVEFALFALILIYMTAGVVNVGGLLNDHISLVYAVRQGARTGSVLGNQANADCAIVDAVYAAVANMPNLTITDIQIYKAGTNGNVLNDASGKPLMDEYRGNNPYCTVSVSGGVSTTTIAPAASTLNYPPANRNNQPFVEDSLGVKVSYAYTIRFTFAGFFTGTFTASDYAVMPVNPIAIPSPVPTPTPIATSTRSSRYIPRIPVDSMSRPLVMPKIGGAI